METLPCQGHSLIISDENCCGHYSRGGTLEEVIEWESWENHWSLALLTLTPDDEGEAYEGGVTKGAQ